MTYKTDILHLRLCIPMVMRSLNKMVERNRSSEDTHGVVEKQLPVQCSAIMLLCLML